MIFFFSRDFFFQSLGKERLGFGSLLNLMKLQFVFVSAAFLFSISMFLTNEKSCSGILWDPLG